MYIFINSCYRNSIFFQFIRKIVFFKMQKIKIWIEISIKVNLHKAISVVQLVYPLSVTFIYFIHYFNYYIVKKTNNEVNICYRKNIFMITYNRIFLLSNEKQLLVVITNYLDKYLLSKNINVDNFNFDNIYYNFLQYLGKLFPSFKHSFI